MSRGAKRDWLQGSSLAAYTDAPRAIRYTDHVKSIQAVEETVPEDYRIIGCIVGTADLMSQIADRFYLERCRDALFWEFSQAGIDVFKSADDLLRQTPGFIEHVKQQRLRTDFRSTHIHFESHFGTTPCPYMASIDRNIDYLKRIIDSQQPAMLKRNIAERLSRVWEFDFFCTMAAT